MAGLLAVPLALAAPPATQIPRVGFVEAGSRSANQHFAAAFRAGLRELGYVDGQNVSVDERWADGRIEQFPELLAVVLNPAVPANERWLTPMQAAAARLGVKLVTFPVRDAEGVDEAFTAMTRAGVGGLIVSTDPLTLRHRVRIVELANGHHLPAMYTFGEFSRAGGLIAYGPSVRNMFRRAATYVDRILKGTRPADLPVEQPTTFELVINLKTAKALGLTIPRSLLLRADHVIE